MLIRHESDVTATPLKYVSSGPLKELGLFGNQAIIFLFSKLSHSASHLTDAQLIPRRASSY
jgi:hypothetical protein